MINFGHYLRLRCHMNLVASLRSQFPEPDVYLHTRNLLGSRGRAFPFVKYNLLVQQDAFKALEQEEMAEIKDACRRRFGSSVYYPYIALYKTFDKARPNGGALKEWMPSDFFNRRVMPQINHNYRGISRIKTLSKRLFGSDCLPDIGYILKGQLYGAGMEPVTAAEFVATHRDSHEFVYIKADDTNTSHGVRRVEIAALDDALVTATQQNSVIQAAVVQHDWLDELCGGSAGVIRINTLFHRSPRPRTIAGVLKMAGGGEKITGERYIKVAVRDDAGTLDGFGLDRNWRLTKAHPDSGLAFEGRVIPHYRDAAEMCETLHARLPHFGFIGWDVGIDRTGTPKVMEWNASSPTIEFAEMAAGPTFAGCGFEEAYR